MEKVCLTKQRDQRNSASVSFGAAKQFNKFKSPEHNKSNADKFGHNTRYVDHSSNNNMESFNEDTDELTDYPLYSLYHMSSKRDTRIPPYTVSVNMNGVDVTMEIDTGCESLLLVKLHITSCGHIQCHLHYLPSLKFYLHTPMNK